MRISNSRFLHPSNCWPPRCQASHTSCFLLGLFQEGSTSGPFTWRSCWSGPSLPPPAVVLQWESDWKWCPGSGGTETLTYLWHGAALSAGLKESPPVCFAHREGQQRSRTTGGSGVGRKSVGAASGWARQEAGRSAWEGAGKDSPSSCWPPAPWQSPGTRTDTDRPPLVWWWSQEHWGQSAVPCSLRERQERLLFTEPQGKGRAGGCETSGARRRQSDGKGWVPRSGFCSALNWTAFFK